jgi:hypothetical protein
MRHHRAPGLQRLPPWSALARTLGVMTDFVFGTHIGLVLAAIVGHAIAAILGRAFPRASLVLAVPSLLAVVASWVLLAVGNFDGPSGGLSMAIIGMVSILLLCASVGLVAGTRRNIGISVGLAVGLTLTAAFLFLFPSAIRSIAVPALVLASPAVGYLLSLFGSSLRPSAQKR